MNDESTRNIRLRIAERRHELELSQEVLADRAGINRSTVVRLEAGLTAWTSPTLLALAHALECNWWDLLPLPDAPRVLDGKMTDMFERLSQMHPRDRELAFRLTREIDNLSTYFDDDYSAAIASHHEELEQKIQADKARLEELQRQLATTRRDAEAARKDYFKYGPEIHGILMDALTLMRQASGADVSARTAELFAELEKAAQVFLPF